MSDDKTQALVVIPPNPMEQLKLEVFTEFETSALETYLANGRSHYALSPILATQLYELFLAGSSCEEITKLNPGLELGQVLEARLVNGWDDARARYTRELMQGAKAKATQTLLEAMEFLQTNLSVAHRAFAKKAKRFLQTGNPKDLPSFTSASKLSWKQYRETLELLLKLSGMSPPERKDINVNHTVNPASVSQPGTSALPAAMTPSSAALALAAIEKAMETGKK